MIARSDEFRTWCSITTGTEAEKIAAALLRIHAYRAPAADSVTLPFALIQWNDKSRNRVGDGGGAFMRSHAMRVAFFEDPGTDGDQQELLDFEDQTDDIIDDMCVLSGDSSNLYYEDVTLEDGPMLLPVLSERGWLYRMDIYSGPQIGSQTET